MVNNQNVNNTFKWEISSFGDPNNANWLKDYDVNRNNRTGNLVNTHNVTKNFSSYFSQMNFFTVLLITRIKMIINPPFSAYNFIFY